MAPKKQPPVKLSKDQLMLRADLRHLVAACADAFDRLVEAERIDDMVNACQDLEARCGDVVSKAVNFRGTMI